jgi:hypothetical protein
MLLKGCGIDCISWMHTMSKTVIPKWRDGTSQFFQDNFDKDNPTQPYRRPRAASPQPPNRYKLCLLTALGILNAAACPNLTFELKSDLLLHNRLRKYRGFQGMLDSNQVPEADLLALRQVINISSQ